MLKNLLSTLFELSKETDACDSVNLQSLSTLFDFIDTRFLERNYYYRLVRQLADDNSFLITAASCI